MPSFTPLSPEEHHIIEEKGTEAPFSGQLTTHTQQGTYLCKRCQTPLYKSQDKFESHCGWPSFDDEIPDRVTRYMDADGQRTEILCSTCFAHLGHVFEGEHLTEKNIRHCVNSLSLTFVPDVITTSPWEIAVFGGGCFWCTEAVFSHLEGVEAVYPGYAGGKRKNPSYEQVCTGTTGHVEVIQIVYDPSRISYTILLDVFFSTHNPTTLNQQGNDHGTQYASVIFVQNTTQEQAVHTIIANLTKQNYWPDPIITTVRPRETFWIAEKEHWAYYAKHPEQAYCQAIINPKLKKLRSTWGHYLKQAR